MLTRAILEARNGVCAAPGDDEARTRLADAYDAEGDGPRAALIRLQLERDALGAHDRRRLELELEARVLLGEFEARWRTQELAAADRVQWGPFERGMVGSAMFDDPTLLARAGVECAKLAPLTRLFVSWPYRKDPPLPALPGVRELTMMGTVYQTADLSRLVSMPLFSTVRGLTLLDANLRDGLEVLAGAGLEALRIPYHHLGLRGLAPLIDADATGLRELVLEAAPASNGGSGDDGHDPAFDERAGFALALWPGLTSIEHLDLSGNRLGIDGLSMLLASPRSAALRQLRLARMGSDAELDDTLAGLRQGSSPLVGLDVSDNRLHSAAVAAIAQSDRCRSLRTLSVQGVSGELGPLTRGRCWASLEVLRCDGSALPTFFDSPPPRLHSLCVDVQGRVDTALETLSRTDMPALLQLELRGVEDLSELLARLGDCTLPSVRALAVPGDLAADPETVAAFLETPFGAALVSFDVDDEDLAMCPARWVEAEGDSYGEPGYQGPLRRLA